MIASNELKTERAKDAFCRLFSANRGDLTTRPVSGSVVKVIDARSFCWADYDISAHRVRRIAEFDARTR